MNAASNSYCGWILWSRAMRFRQGTGLSSCCAFGYCLRTPRCGRASKTHFDDCVHHVPEAPVAAFRVVPCVGGPGGEKPFLVVSGSGACGPSADVPGGQT